MRFLWPGRVGLACAEDYFTAKNIGAVGGRARQSQLRSPDAGQMTVRAAAPL